MATHSSSFTVGKSVTSTFVEPDIGRWHYSSMKFNGGYETATVADGSFPGPKWAAKKFETGIHASAANERYVSMRKDQEDLRPFGGAVFDE